MIANILHNDILPRTRLKNVGIRFALALISGVSLLLTFMVPLKVLSLFECPFLAIVGLPCPFCGFTRSLWAISAGDWWYATVNCPLAWLLYAALVFVFAGNITCLLPGTKINRLCGLSLPRNQANRAAGIIIALFLLNWLYRLHLGLT
jgi:hypothetical protein